VQLLEQAVARDPTFLLASLPARLRERYRYILANYDHTEARLAISRKQYRCCVLVFSPMRRDTSRAGRITFFGVIVNYRRAREELVESQRELPNNAQVFSDVRSK